MNHQDKQSKEKNASIDKLHELTNVVSQIAEVQAAELEVRREELTVKQAEISANRDIALASIKAQMDFHAGRGNVINRQQVNRYGFAVTVLVIVLAFAAWLFLHDGKDLVLTLAKEAFIFASGAFGGYHFGKNKATSEQQEED